MRVTHDRVRLVIQTEASLLALARTMLADGRARQLRLKHHLSLAEVAAVIGVEPAMIAKWETGRSRPRAANALAYAALLGELAESDQDAGDGS